MIVVDSSVWIAHLRNMQTPATDKLEAAAAREPLLIGDVVLLEVLQGARDDGHASRIERLLRQYAVVSFLGVEIAIRAADNYRRLRAQGITIRKTIDVVIATFCIENRHALLHDDHDFDPMEKHLGLIVV